MIGAAFSYLLDFACFFWSVFSFWLCWQLCDFALSRLKVKLKKPWSVEAFHQTGKSDRITAWNTEQEKS